MPNNDRKLAVIGFIRLKTGQVGRAAVVLLLLATLAPCSGCAYFGNWSKNGFKVGPDYCKPAAPVADEWIDFNDPRVISDSHQVREAAWWHTFNDSAMDNLVQTAYQQNLPLRIAGMRVLEAQGQRAIAAGFFFPQFQEAFAEYNRVQLSRNGSAAGPVPTPVRSFDFWSTGLNLSWEIDIWGRIRRGIESADANLDAQIENYDDVLVLLIADTATAYVQMRSFERRLAYARANVQSQQGSLGIAESRFRNGAVSQLDVTQAQSNLGQTQALIPVLEQGLRQANNRLCVLLGVPPRDLRGELGDGPIPSAPNDVVVGIPADLIRRRPDIRRAEREVASQSALIGVATSDLFPAFTINGSLNWQANRLTNLFSGASNAGFVGPVFNWNILNYGRIVNNVRVEDARFQQLAVAYQQTVLGANREAEDAIIGFLKSQEQAKFLQYSVKATERSVELSLTQYREGATDFNRVFNLQSLLVTQQDQLATAQSDIATNLIRIYKALGGGWQIRQGPGMPPPEPVELPPAVLENGAPPQP